MQTWREAHTPRPSGRSVHSLPLSLSRHLDCIMKFTKCQGLVGFSAAPQPRTLPYHHRRKRVRTLGGTSAAPATSPLRPRYVLTPPHFVRLVLSAPRQQGLGNCQTPHERYVGAFLP